MKKNEILMLLFLLIFLWIGKIQGVVLEAVNYALFFPPYINLKNEKEYGKRNIYFVSVNILLLIFLLLKKVGKL